APACPPRYAGGESRGEPGIAPISSAGSRSRYHSPNPMSAVQDASVLVGKAGSPAPIERIGRLWTYRGLLLNLVKRDLRIRYKESALGFLWSMLNPATYLAIFYVVFVILLPAGIPHFPVFILSGLLPWT